MKLFDVDWRLVFRALPGWQALSPGARRFVLEHVKPSHPIPLSMPPEALGELAGAGFIRLTNSKWRQWAVTETHRPVVRVLRAMHRQRVFDPGFSTPADYLWEHFSRDELGALQPNAHRLGYHHGELDRAVQAREWLDDFLASNGSQGRFRNTLGDAQDLVRELLPHPRGVPLLDVVRDWTEGQPEEEGALAAALLYGLSRVVLFASLRGKDDDPVVGVWPGIVRAVERGPASAAMPAPSSAPAPASAAPATLAAVTPEITFDAPIVLEDATTVLAAAAAEPLAVRASDNALYARTTQLLEDRLMEIPEWAVEATELGSLYRLNLALSALTRLGFISGTEREPLRLRPTAAGTRWLGLSARGRFDALLNSVRQSPDRAPTPEYGFGHRPSPGIRFFSPRVTLPLYRPQDVVDLRTPLAEAWLSVPPDSYVVHAEFLSHHSERNNPLLQSQGTRILGSMMQFAFGHGRSNATAQREYATRTWYNVLATFFTDRLLSFGGARVGRLADGRLCFTLTDVGRYLLGATKTFTYQGDTPADVIVQPNFEIVFLAPAPVLEARLARFAERTGQRTGVLFRLTRASVLAAIEAGMTGDDIVETLRALSSKALPQNVMHQVRDWASAVRHVTRRSAILLECPDAETAMKVRSVAGAKVQPLTDTIVEVVETKAGKLDPALVKRLRQAGVFVERRG